MQAFISLLCFPRFIGFLQTALHFAVDSLEIVRILIEVGGANPNAKDVDGRTPLHTSADLDVMQALVAGTSYPLFSARAHPCVGVCLGCACNKWQKNLPIAFASVTYIPANTAQREGTLRRPMVAAERRCGTRTSWTGRGGW